PSPQTTKILPPDHQCLNIWNVQTSFLYRWTTGDTGIVIIACSSMRFKLVSLCCILHTLSKPTFSLCCCLHNDLVCLLIAESHDSFYTYNNVVYTRLLLIQQRRVSADHY
ncbi:MAG TPA: hypothetical protein VL485_11285, partial [Ktedonobacteraceae bacterium]|nr:hypothetical protein [Ktedonobacteraceae bacterium]